MADYGAYNNFIPADQISARINSSAFTFTGNAEVGQLYEETDANGAGYYSYVLLFRDVIYNGGGNSVPINLSYLNSTMAMQQLSVTLGQCVDEDPDTPNLMIRASSYGNEAVVAGTPFTLTLTNGDTESPKTQSYKLKIVGVVSEESEDYMLQYGITFRLNDLLMLSEAYSKLAKTDFNPKKVTYNEVYIKVDDIKNVDKICDTLKEEGYQISSMVDYRKQMQQQTAQRQLRLAGLAAISLFVAALNIANTMTMAIYERTREIGVMKVLGCEIGNIRRMFLIESGMIGFIGGVAGTILSYIISFGMNNMTMIVYGLNTLLMKLGINATIDLSSLMGSSDSMYYGGGMYMSDSGSGTVMSIIPFWLVLAAIGFAVVVGLLSGIVPASRAVRISALEAIRHD